MALVGIILLTVGTALTLATRLPDALTWLHETGIVLAVTGAALILLTWVPYIT